ncbi:MAG: hypothetical protein J5676_07005 [Bacteroidaceae bacterium]|nr:hypothetical protein [Bacteroidaceae bacterium]
MKNLGIIIIIIAAIALIACGVLGEVNNNLITFGCVGLAVIGLIVHILVNKKITE